MQAEGGHKNEERIDVDGLPHVGAVIYPGQAYNSRVDCATGAHSARPAVHVASACFSWALRPSRVYHAACAQDRNRFRSHMLLCML